MPATRTPLRTLAVCLAFTAACAQPAPPPEKPAEPAHDAAMDMHHLHGLMSHGLEMALEGATLQMLGQMNMAGAIDKTAIDHGTAMMSEGRGLINSAIAGPAMAAMHTANANDPLMAYTHDLARTMGTVLDHLQQMPAPDAKNQKDMALHHMHIALVHAALMATQGASLKMSASMKMSEAIDAEASTHGSAMFLHARGLYAETINGEAMKAAHAADGGDSMTATHNLGESVNALIESLAKMP
ncbi:MAG: hypothetical protein ABL982_12795 [Vicinamibacterales bacterium]